MNRAELLQRIQELGVWKRGDQRAPHNREVDAPLRELLRDFGPPRKATHPEYPFWWLQTDKIWEVADGTTFRRRSENKNPPKSELLGRDAQAGFTEPVQKLLQRDAGLRAIVARKLLSAHFPESLHLEIMDRVGLNLDSGGSEDKERRRRDPEFRRRVIRAYDHRCAICGFGLRLGNEDICLEAAHIKWHQAGGPDSEQNGLALCVMHHRMLDRGAFTVDGHHRVAVSADVHGDGQIPRWLVGFHGRPMRPPQSSTHLPAPEFVAWHQKQVFRGPSRTGEGH
jgi:putative restriction endonuclease